MKLGFAIAAVISAFAVTSASAATVQLLSPQPVLAYTNPTPNSTTGGVSVDVLGSLAGQYKDVYQGVVGLENVNPFNAIKRLGSMTYNLAGGAGSFFTVIWGSVDRGNLLTINKISGGTEVITGTNVLNLGAFVAGSSNVLVKIISENAYGSVTLSTSVNSFEHAFNPAEVTAVPLPAAGLLLMAAVGGLGAVARRRKAA